MPVWGVWVAGNLYFGTDKTSVKARNIGRDQRVVIHLESGDDTVIFEGELVLADAPKSLQDEIDAEYMRKYELDPAMDDTGVLQFQLVPRKVMAWLESDYPATATYWLFDS